MKAMTKIALVSASVLSMGALTACQSTSNVSSTDQSPMMKHHGKHKHHAKKHLTPEQRQQFEAAREQRAELFKQMKTACENKAVGSAITIKSGDKTLAGTCAIHFKPDAKDLKAFKAQNKPMRGEHRVKRGEDLTDAQKAEFKKQLEQRRAERQAQQQAWLDACQGKKDGAKVQIKVGEQAINGQCQVHFQPERPAKLNNASK
ncbi:hypothetical protein A3K93_02045 [Acinetobacter sp. NCu2D-2]|uniref:hypothetical protein n=1 Tax=Acinetobacter sp. NCu2D-2 TaxID=1608473 RepID=UPI0007CDFF49|nr:hypothetical protein [Acinetobacter sp. NCu2D-2]ANF83069.1 hypothetical protein A3K93_02045 [Acinetobacter sp. NCu2D-2]